MTGSTLVQDMRRRFDEVAARFDRRTWEVGQPCAQLSARQAHTLVLNHDPGRGFYCVTVGPGRGVRGGWRALRFARGSDQ